MADGRRALWSRAVQVSAAAVAGGVDINHLVSWVSISHLQNGEMGLALAGPH